MVEEVCAWCGERFEAEKRSKFCSEACQEAARMEKRRIAYRRRYAEHKDITPRTDGKWERVCLNCGRTFLADDYRAKICSEECRRERKGIVRMKREERYTAEVPHESTIVEIVLEGRKHGLSFGKEMARRFLHG